MIVIVNDSPGTATQHKQYKNTKVWQTLRIGDPGKKALPTIRTYSGTHSVKKAKSSCFETLIRVYIAGIPYSTYHQTRDLLRTKLPGFQLDWIQNLAWIEKTVIEMSIHQTHSETIKRLFEKNKSSEYYLLHNFDSLNPNSFNWEKEILPEDQELILRQNLAKRLARSAATTNKSATSDELRDYAHHRGIGGTFDKILQKSTHSGSSISG